ncbi:hypothetical protein [Parageobacillus thermoglucosidasius]|uniref:Uncharacterized protein n=1 Tax=Parageobacillus thermoglucosidasius TaxID=1426 RepID=A0AB38QZJ5_PARTM|nr:hypothetical protein [Parageobacillus thermoglucosidasius]UOE76858.1 hypothetical protein IMI45_03035 [Parageobacillus thermoglucosidasius]
MAAKEDFMSGSKKKKQRAKCSLPSLFKAVRSNFNSLSSLAAQSRFGEQMRPLSSMLRRGIYRHFRNGKTIF